jgi:hypothetical protein
LNILSFKLLGAVAVAGLVAAGGTAFTASGVAFNGTSATGTQLVGAGSVTQTVDGAVVESVVYGTTAGEVDTVTVTFTTDLPTGASVSLTGNSVGEGPLSSTLGSEPDPGLTGPYVFTLSTAVSDLEDISIMVNN